MGQNKGKKTAFDPPQRLSCTKDVMKEYQTDLK